MKTIIIYPSICQRYHAGVGGSRSVVPKRRDLVKEENKGEETIPSPAVASRIRKNLRRDDK